MYAKLLDRETTGNASSATGIEPKGLYIAPGTVSNEELLKTLDSGLYLTSLQGLHAGANVQSGDFSLQADGFLVEKGVKTAPVKNFTVAGNFFQLLKQVAAVSSEVKFGVGSDYGAPDVLLTGMAISQFSIKELLCNRRVYIICAVRIVLMPVLVWALVKLCRLNFALMPAVLLYAMPCGMNTIVFPKLVEKDCRLGAGTVLVSTALSMLTIPLCLYFLLS
jgi:hypothetical protein